MWSTQNENRGKNSKDLKRQVYSDAAQQVTSVTEYTTLKMHVEEGLRSLALLKRWHY